MQWAIKLNSGILVRALRDWLQPQTILPINKSVYKQYESLI